MYIVDCSPWNFSYLVKVNDIITFHVYSWCDPRRVYAYLMRYNCNLRKSGSEETFSFLA
jgi:hypothetical protein